MDSMNATSVRAREDFLLMGTAIVCPVLARAGALLRPTEPANTVHASVEVLFFHETFDQHLRNEQTQAHRENDQNGSHAVPRDLSQ